MFVRKKRNKSRVVSVQVIEKRAGKYKMVKTIGSSSGQSVIDQLFKQGNDF